MINVATITKQIQDWLEDAEALQGYTIERAEPLNEDAGRATNGWIGIYRRSLDYDPRHMGVASNNYAGALDFMLIVQRSSMLNGSDCEDKLEASVKSVLDRTVDLPKTYIDHFSDITIDYTYLEGERKSMYFQGALITFTAEVSIEVQ